MLKLVKYSIALLLCMMIGSMMSLWLFLPYQGLADNRVKIYGSPKVDLKKITSLLNNSPIRGSQQVHLFLVPRWLMIMINPLYGINAQGFNYPVLNTVLVYQDAAKDTARTLEGTIAHETTHTDINENFGLKTIFYSRWKIEGACDYVSQETSIFSKDKEEVLKKYHEHQSLNGKENYLIYKMKVQYWIDQGKSLKQILTEDLPEPTI